MKVAEEGLYESLRKDESLRKGVNTMDGMCTLESLANSLGIKHNNINLVIEELKEAI